MIPSLINTVGGNWPDEQRLDAAIPNCRTLMKAACHLLQKYGNLAAA